MSSNITLSPFDEVFKHIKDKLPSDTLKTLEQNYNNQDKPNSLFIKNQKDLEAYKLPNTKAQVEHIKQAELNKIKQEELDRANSLEQIKSRDESLKYRAKKLEEEKAKTEKVLKLNSLVEQYKALGGDTSIFQKELDEFYSRNEIGYGEKFKLMAKKQIRDYSNTFNKGIAYLDNKEYKPQYSNDELLEIEKIKRDKAINPIKTIIMDELLDPATFIAPAFSKGTKAARFTKDFVKNAPLTGGLHSLKHGGDDDYTFKDSLYAGGIGGTAGTIFGKAFPKGANALSDIEQVQAKVKNNVSLNENKSDITDSQIASKLSDDIDKLSPNQANINPIEDLSNPNILNSMSKADKQESINVLEKLRNEIEYNKLSPEEQGIYDVFR